MSRPKGTTKISRQACRLIQLSPAPQRLLASAYSVSQKTIWRIQYGRKKAVPTHHLTDAERKQIASMSYEHPTEIARRYGVSRKTIWRIHKCQ